MHKPSVSRMSLIASVAASLGMFGNHATAQVLKKKRGKAPEGMKFTTGVYVPGGPRCNVEPTKIKNPKIAANIDMMHQKWLDAKTSRQVAIK